MKTLLEFDFPYPGPFGEAATERLRPLAEDISRTPGLIWKIWLDDATNGRSGGVYLFEDEASARAYLEMHTQRLAGFGITDIRSSSFPINEALSRITHAPVDPARVG